MTFLDQVVPVTEIFYNRLHDSLSSLKFKIVIILIKIDVVLLNDAYRLQRFSINIIIALK